VRTHNLLVQSIVRKHVARVGQCYFRGRLLDIGCGSKPYRSLLASQVSEHVGLDHHDSIHAKDEVDLFGPAYDIPARDDSFDSVLCTAVLEHLEEPEAAIRECHRVLKPGGVAAYTVPFIWHLHEEPRDFYRFTKHGLEYLFRKTGFEIVELQPLSGFWITFGQLLVYNVYRFNRGPLRWFRIVPAMGLAMQGLAWTLDHIDRTEQWTWMYLVVARKPVGEVSHAA
jgi:SAM-dependent methyltransferase